MARPPLGPSTPWAISHLTRPCGPPARPAPNAPTLPLPQISAVSVDFAGNASVLAAIHTALGDHLKYSCLVGATHIEARGGGGEPLAGPQPILFFAPDHAAASIKELGPKAFGEAVAACWHGFLDVTDGFMQLDHRDGLSAAADAFRETVAGKADPSTGIVVRP